MHIIFVIGLPSTCHRR